MYKMLAQMKAKSVSLGDEVHEHKLALSPVFSLLPERPHGERHAGHLREALFAGDTQTCTKALKSRKHLSDDVAR